MESEETNKRYSRPHRLEDVLVLIQALAATPNKTGQVSDGALSGERTRLRPQSANSWAEIAKEHPEFFRLSGQADDAVMLVYQYISQARPSDEIVGKLMDIAVATHDREIERSQKAHERELELHKISLTKWSILSSTIAAVGSVTVAILAILMKKGP